MKKKQLDYLTESDDKLRRAEEAFIGTFNYDDGLPVRRHSGRYYTSGGEMSGFGTAMGAVSSIVTPLVSSIIDQAKNTTYKDLTAQRDYNNRSVLEGISDNDALLMAYDNLDWGSTKKGKDFRNGTVFGDVSDSLMGGVSAGLSTGNPYIAGGAALAGLAGNIYKWSKAGSDAKKWNEGLADYRADLSRKFNTVADTVKLMNNRRALEAFYNSAAFGGELSTHGSNWDNGLVEINAGGSHESNPNEGVPAGVDENGTPNLVEEGEVIWNNEYVFSKRLKVPQKMRSKYKLGGPISYADAIKKLTKESEERKNDPISNSTTKAIVNDFIDSQEEVRAKKQQRAAERLQQAQYENDLLNAIAGLGTNQGPVASIDMQAPVQEVPQEAPVIEQMGAYGGKLFEDGGHLDEAKEYIESLGISDADLKSKLISDLAAQLNKIDSTYADGTDLWNKAVKDAYNSIAVKSKAAQQQDNNSIQKSSTDLYNEVATKRKAADEYLHFLGYLNPQNARRGQLSRDQRKVYDSLIRGDYSNWKEHPNYKYVNGPSKEEILDNAENIGAYSEGEFLGPFKPETIVEEQVQQNRGSNTGGDTPPSPPSSRSGDIKYNRSINGKEFESQEYYQNFLNYLNNQATDEEISNWIGKINADIKAQGDSYTVKNKADLIRLATDGKVGPVHQAFFKSATEWGNAPTKRPSFGLEKLTGLEDALAKYNNDIYGNRTGIAELDVPDFSEHRDLPKQRGNFDWRREAPIWGGLFQSLVGLVGEPDYSEANQMISGAKKLATKLNIPVDLVPDMEKRRPYDERYMVNLANQNKFAAERNAANTSGGNRAMQLGMDAYLAHSNQAELAEIMRQAYLANRQDEFTTAEFNRGTNVQNASAINSRNLAQAQLNSQREQAGFSGLVNGLNTKLQQRTAWDATTGQNLSNLFNNLSIRGKEAITDNMVQSMYENGYYPHKMNPDGTIEFAPIEGVRISKCGGNLKKKRRF